VETLFSERRRSAAAAADSDDEGPPIASAPAPRGFIPVYPAANGIFGCGVAVCALTVPPNYSGKARSVAELAGGFSFSRDCSYKVVNYNSELTGLLELLLVSYEAKLSTNDEFRARNLKTLIGSIKTCPHSVMQSWELAAAWLGALPNSGFGQSWAAKLNTFATHGKLVELDYRMADGRRTAEIEMKRVHGIGPVKAKQLVQLGYETLKQLGDDLKAVPMSLEGRAAQSILVGAPLKCLPIVEDLETKILRPEVDEIRATVVAAVEAVFGPDVATVTVCGSYRRGKDKCGDVDVLITPKVPMLHVCRRKLEGALKDGETLHVDGRGRRWAYWRDHFGRPGHLPLQPVLELLKSSGFLTHDLTSVETGNDMHGRGDNSSMAAQSKDWGKLAAAEDKEGLAAAKRAYRTYQANSLEETTKRMQAQADGTFSAFQGGVASGRGRGGRGRGGRGRRGRGGIKTDPSPENSANGVKWQRVGGDDGGTDSDEGEDDAGGIEMEVSELGKGPPHAAGYGRGAGGEAPRPTDLPFLPWPAVAYPSSSVMAVCRLGDGPYRRIDIKSYPRELQAAALLYFTGSGYFNRSLRLFVHHCGWSMSDRGLAPAIRQRKAKRVGVTSAGSWDKVWEGHSVACETEEDLFRACGLPYLTPYQRECGVTEISVVQAVQAREEAVREAARRRDGGAEGPAPPFKIVLPGGLEGLRKFAQSNGNPAEKAACEALLKGPGVRESAAGEPSEEGAASLGLFLEAEDVAGLGAVSDEEGEGEG
jgi:DNA polymerase/3'-5' exonuclease PolX